MNKPVNMNRFINYLDKLQNQNKFNNIQLYITVACIFSFLAIAITLPNYILQNQQIMKGQAAGLQTSALWGQNGELWNTSRLPDWSTAGYRGGQALPEINPTKNIKTDFGAKGDGVSDDTNAFITAVASGGHIRVPAGRYIINRRIIFTKSNTVLKGDGQDQTILYFPKHLYDAEGNCSAATGGGDSIQCYSWQEGFLSAKGSFNEIGIENLNIEFPNVGYRGHHKELGYNAIYFLGTGSVSNCWVRNVTIKNADSGLIARGYTNNCTFTGIRINGRGGHHGIFIRTGDRHLVTDFKIDTTYVHDISLEHDASYNVFSNGSGTDLNFDHHGWSPQPNFNLFTNINMGAGRRPFDSGGDDPVHSGPNEVFWNIHKSNNEPVVNDKIVIGRFNQVPPNAVAVGAWQTRTPGQNNQWIEGIMPANLCPKNLHEAQVARKNGQNICAPDNEPPTAPSSLTSSNTTDKSTTLTWGASTDNIAVASYYLERCQGNSCNNFSQIAGLSGTSYTDTSLAANSTYSYRIRAKDSAGNYSGYSNITTAATLACQGSIMQCAAITSHSNNFDPAHTPDNMTDGCLTDAAECSTGAGNIDSFWIEYDLGTLKSLTQTRLHGDAGGTWVSESWTLKHKQSSSDPWTTAFTNSPSLGNQWYTKPLNTNARYIRLEVNGNSQFTPGRTQAREFELSEGTISTPTNTPPTATTVPSQGSVPLTTGATLPIARDAVSNRTFTKVASVSWQHATSGNDRLLTVAIGATDTNRRTVTAVSYNGMPLTKINRDSRDHMWTELWYIVNPSLGTHTIDIKLSGTVSHGGVAGATSLTSVDQGNPLGATAKINTVGSSISAIVHATTAGSWTIDSLVVEDDPPTGGQNQTVAWSRERLRDEWVSQSTEVSTGGDITMSSSWRRNNRAAMVAAEFKPKIAAP
jgi:hypothetical protein